MTQRRRGERGASAVEFALLLPFLLLLVGGIIDLGRLFYTQNIVVNAAREGARMMALGYPQTSASGASADQRIGQAMIAYQGTGYTTAYTYKDHTGTTVTGSTAKCPTSNPDPNDRIAVRVTVTGFNYLLLGGVSNLFGGALIPPSPFGAAEMRCGG
jgi:Flp pilus assembly protein TadG